MVNNAQINQDKFVKFCKITKLNDAAQKENAKNMVDIFNSRSIP